MAWSKFSENKLAALEKKILSVLKTPYHVSHVPVKSAQGTEEKIWTISLNTESNNTPLVLVHGFAAAIGFWCLNLDYLAANRPVYAFDILGFGRSSRPDYSKDASEAEAQLVQSIEDWRKHMKLEKFILLGHSMGGYLSTSYAIKYPERIKHLILAEPWGFAEKDPDAKRPSSFFIRTLACVLSPLTRLNPLATVRGAGPLGPWLIQKLRSDIANKYSDVIGDEHLITEYIYHCNAQKPTGETAFHNMIEGFGWAKNPMIHRVHNLKNEIPITIMYGTMSWMDPKIGEKVIELRPESYVKMKLVNGAGHHVNADQPNDFNRIVINTCTFSDKSTTPNKNIEELDKSHDKTNTDNQSLADSTSKGSIESNGNMLMNSEKAHDDPGPAVLEVGSAL